jgi:ABC-type Fe3+-hydroxamate transport system substrate-binding protein
MANHPNRSRRLSQLQIAALTEAADRGVKCVQRPEGIVVASPHSYQALDALRGKGLVDWQKQFKSDIFYARATDAGRDALARSSAKRR